MVGAVPRGDDVLLEVFLFSVDDVLRGDVLLEVFLFGVDDVLRGDVLLEEFGCGWWSRHGVGKGT